MSTQYVKGNLTLSRMNLHNNIITYYYYYYHDSYGCGIEHVKDEMACISAKIIMALQGVFCSLVPRPFEEEEKGPVGVQLGVFMINANFKDEHWL